jgi:hypothetical protein
MQLTPKFRIGSECMASFGSTAYRTTSTPVRTGCGLQEQPIRRPERCLVCKATCPGGPSGSFTRPFPIERNMGARVTAGWLAEFCSKKRAHIAQVRNGRNIACVSARVCEHSLPPAEH